MRITRIEPLFVDRYLFVQVHTDDGLVGLGESGAWGFLEASAAVVETFATLPGRPGPAAHRAPLAVPLPLRPTSAARRSWARSARSTSRCGTSPASTSACPSTSCSGGRTRDKARVYYHVFGETTEDLVAAAASTRSAQGFTAVGHLTPFLDEPRDEPYFKTHAAKIGRRDRRRAAVPRGGRRRGRPLHRDPPPADAGRGGRARRAASSRTTRYSTRTRSCPTTSTRWRWSPSKIHIPIATGERLTRIYEFQMLLARGAVQYVRPDVCMCGGITGAKKIAALAEAHHVGVVPHNPLGPVSTAACLQLAACIPNFAIQEYPSSTWSSADVRPPEAEMVDGAAEHDGEGYLPVPDAPRHRGDVARGRARAVPVPAAADEVAPQRRRLGRRPVTCPVRLSVGRGAGPSPGRAGGRRRAAAAAAAGWASPPGSTRRARRAAVGRRRAHDDRPR